MTKKNGHGASLTLFIVIAIVAAIALALLAPNAAASLHMGGEVFLRLLQMVVVPLVMASVMSGILGLGDVRKLGKPGLFAVAYYMCTTVLAVLTGLVVVNVINPGKGIDPSLVKAAQQEAASDVERARRAGGDGSMLTWRMGLTTQRDKPGVSDAVPVTHDHSIELQLRFVQLEDLGEDQQQPAVVIVQTSKDGRKWEQLGEPVSAPVKQSDVKKNIPLPKHAHHVRVDFQPNDGVGSTVLMAETVRGPPSLGDIFQNLVLMLFTDNLLGSMVSVNLLPLIVFSIVFAGMLTTMGSGADTIRSLVLSINEALLNFILLLMKLAPIGIFCLVAARFGEAQSEGSLVDLLKSQARYMLTVLSGLGIHALVTLPLILWIVTRRNPLVFMGQMSQAVLTAFSTASSTASLPVSMECAETKAKVSKRSTEFVLPLGATINMDGTALYEAAAAIFIAQAYAVVDPNFQLGLVEQATIAVTATLAAIGAAGIPEAGLVTMLIVLNAVGLPLELIGLILPVDWLLDRFRTAVNVFGDSVGSAVVDGSFGPDEPPPNATAKPPVPSS